MVVDVITSIKADSINLYSCGHKYRDTLHDFIFIIILLLLFFIKIKLRVTMLKVQVF